MLMSVNSNIAVLASQVLIQRNCYVFSIKADHGREMASELNLRNKLKSLLLREWLFESIIFVEKYVI